MIRFLLIALFLGSFLLLSIPLLLLLPLVGLWNPGWRDKAYFAIVQWAFRCILRISGVEVIIEGREHLPQGESVLYVANHRSYFDILLTCVHMPSITGYVAKKEMLRYILLRDWMRGIYCLFLDRKDVKQGFRTILTGAEQIQRGISMCIFPEGTRNKSGQDFLPFHEGSFKMAEKARVPVIPISIIGSHAMFEDHMPMVRPAKVILVYGQPIYLERLEKEQRRQPGRYVQQVIEENYYRHAPTGSLPQT